MLIWQSYNLILKFLTHHFKYLKISWGIKRMNVTISLSLSLLNILYNLFVNICMHEQRNIFISKRKTSLISGILKCSLTIMHASFSSHYLISQAFFGLGTKSKLTQSEKTSTCFWMLCHREPNPIPIQWKMNFCSLLSWVANLDPDSRNRTMSDRIKT